MEKFFGVRDLSNDEYKIYLSKKYGIVKDELLDKYETENKFFGSLDNALRHAHALEVSNFFEAVCPNCDSIISSNELECPICKASFGANSSWRLSPISRKESKPHTNQKHKEIKDNEAGSELTQNTNGKEMTIFLLTILSILAVPFFIYGLSGSSLFNSSSSEVEKFSDQKLRDIGMCMGAVIYNRSMSAQFKKEFGGKYGPMWDGVLDKAKKKCKGANFLSCAEQYLTKKEFILVDAYGDAVAFINSPQDPTRLPNHEVASMMCMGL